VANETDEQRGHRLHESLLAGDPTAQSRIAEEILPGVSEQLSRYRIAQRTDEQLAADAVVDAFIDYVERPASFDPRKLSLPAFLRLAAHRNLLNLRQKPAVQKKYEKAVELASPDRNEDWEEELIERDERHALLARIPGGSLAEKVAAILPDLTDQSLCMLMLEGERETAVYADLLGLSGEPEQLRREVKKQKDRITKVLQRYRKDLHHGGAES
jgi:DNA-directed RNA polymerase specialized sigma24 family protein